MPVHDNATMCRLLETFFNPMTYVSHHVSIKDSVAAMYLLTMRQYASRTLNGSIENELQTNMRLLKALATNLPPQATPHRSSRKTLTHFEEDNLPSAQPTPVPSSFDLRASQEFVATSETLQQTPTVNNSRQTRRSKRALDVDEAELSDSKRFATPKTNRRLFTSLQTWKLIDANAKSSPNPPQ